VKGAPAKPIKGKSGFSASRLANRFHHEIERVNGFDFAQAINVRACAHGVVKLRAFAFGKL
jgi:hypothetical protein